MVTGLRPRQGARRQLRTVRGLGSSPAPSTQPRPQGARPPGPEEGPPAPHPEPHPPPARLGGAFTPWHVPRIPYGEESLGLSEATIWPRSAQPREGQGRGQKQTVAPAAAPAWPWPLTGHRQVARLHPKEHRDPGSERRETDAHRARGCSAQSQPPDPAPQQPAATLTSALVAAA